MFLSIFRFLCGISFLKLHLFIIYFVYVVEDKKWHGSRDKVRGQRSVSSLLPPSVSGDQARVARLSDTHLYLACILCAMRTRKPEKASDTLKLEEMSLSHPVGSGTLTQFLW